MREDKLNEDRFNFIPHREYFGFIIILVFPCGLSIKLIMKYLLLLLDLPMFAVLLENLFLDLFDGFIGAISMILEVF